MSFTALDLGFEALDSLAGVDSVCLFVGEEDRPLTSLAGFVDWRLCGALSRMISDNVFIGEAGDKLLMPSDGRIAMGRIFVFGTGKRSQLKAAGLSELMASAAKTLSQARADRVALSVPGAGLVDDAARSEALTQGFLPGFKGSQVSVLAEKGLKAVLPRLGSG